VNNLKTRFFLIVKNEFLCYRSHEKNEDILIIEKNILAFLKVRLYCRYKGSLIDFKFILFIIAYMVVIVRGSCFNP